MTEASKPEAARAAEYAMRPAPAEQLNNWIAAMHAATKHRSEDSAGLELIRGLYRSILAKYPGSVAREACVKLTTGSEWFPTAKELTETCDRLADPIRALAEAVISWRPKPEGKVEADRAYGRLQRAREELDDMNRSLGFVGNIHELSPARRALWENVCQQIAEVTRLDKEHRQLEREAA